MSHSSTVLFSVLISAVFIVPLNVDAEDCETELQVRRNTIYEASLGQQLKIECPAVFCNNLLPTVNWYKREEKFVLLNINNTSRIKTEWENLNPSKGISYLIFQSIISSDNGSYHCKSGGSVSHAVYIIVNGIPDPTTTASFQLGTSENAASPIMSHYYLYRFVGIGVFLIILISMCVAPQMVLKGRCKKTAAPSLQSSDQIYENV